MAAKLLFVGGVLSCLLFCDVARSQEIDFTVALRRSPSYPTAPHRVSTATEIDWSFALQRRPVAKPADQMPSSWDQAVIRSSPPQQQQAAKKPNRLEKDTEQALFFTASWCTYCDVQKSYLLPKVAALGLTMSESPDADFRLVDIERNRNLQAEYQVKNLPCVVYLDKDKREVDRVIGFDKARLKTPQLQTLK
jgi:thiol-disulfide isomerase/thioredoxin